MKHIELEIQESDWELTGDVHAGDDPYSRLYCRVDIGLASHHLEAIQVKSDCPLSSLNTAVNPVFQKVLDQITEINGDAPAMTSRVIVFGREYLIHMVPFA